MMTAVVRRPILNGRTVETVDLLGLTKAEVLELRDATQYTSRPVLLELRALLERALTGV